MPTQYLWGPFKTLQGTTIVQSRVSVCDLIVLGTKERKHPDKVGLTYVTIITVEKKCRKTMEGREEKRHYMRVERDKSETRGVQHKTFSCIRTCSELEVRC